MLRIVLFILFTQNYIVFSKNESISEVQNLLQNYSYEDEMQFKRKGEKYGIIDNLEKLLLNDSVFKNFTKNVSFLKKKLRVKIRTCWLQHSAKNLALFNEARNFPFRPEIQCFTCLGLLSWLLF